ncbi:MAG: hypothetical protein A3J38_02305 [Gammaproteobacteria bacterium RIFCSPHIGHO2_12_FULL_45_9]|nr:MAG: hypothetical protein A3J38_02305 [Gammaproteobacteria bacterium RIFCSPHIGHO2_12_FULL_45_9]
MQASPMAANYRVVDGPEGLASALTDLFEQSKNDPVFAAEGHYLLYQLGQQKSLIKVDMSVQPFQFWYYDLLGRPATAAVKETVASFLLDKASEREYS